MNKIIKRCSGIDVFRIIAAFMVIAIHTYPLKSLSPTADFILTRVICRVAVPFFFMTSGYFLISEYAENTKKLTDFLKKTAVIYCISIAVYIPINIYSGYFNDEGILPKLIKDIIFNGTMYHLWYLPAAMLGACIAWLTVRKTGFTRAMIITAALYVLGLFGDSYYGITENIGILKEIYGAFFEISEYTRGGIFFAPVFFVIGGAAAKYRRDFKTSDAMLFVLFFDLMLIEGLTLRHFKLQRHDCMYIFLVPCVYFLFRCLLSFQGTHKKSLSRVALVMYIIHPMVIVAVRLAAKLTGTEALLIDNSFIHFAAVSSISVLLAFVWVKLCTKKYGIKPKRAWREIDVKALLHNAEVLKALCSDGCELMAVVKADAYGHGAYVVSRSLEEHGIKAFAVATIDEGIELRRFGIHGEILILGYTSPERVRELKKYRLTQTVVSIEHAKALETQKQRINVHLKVDTGMHRLGFSPREIDEIISCFQMKYLNVTGVFSHLCVADMTDADSVAFTKIQRECFEKITDALSKNGIKIPKKHLLSSYGLLNYSETESDYARVGIALYGVYSSPDDRVKCDIDLRPVLKLKGRIVQMKSVSEGDTVGYGRQFKASEDTKIATVSIGYADGVPRALSSRGSVMINGEKAPIAGRICMDQMSVDVTDILNVAVGDTVTIIGDGISAESVAEQCGTITNELFSRLGKRLETVIMNR